VTAVVRRVDDAAGLGRGLGDLDVLADALDLAQDRVQRMFERTVDGVALRRAQLFQIRLDPRPCGAAALAVAPQQVACDLFPRQYGLGDLVDHRQGRTIPKWKWNKWKNWKR
jgi:hypothetical protein